MAARSSHRFGSRWSEARIRDAALLTARSLALALAASCCGSPQAADRLDRRPPRAGSAPGAILEAAESEVRTAFGREAAARHLELIGVLPRTSYPVREYEVAYRFRLEAEGARFEVPVGVFVDAFGQVVGSQGLVRCAADPRLCPPFTTGPAEAVAIARAGGLAPLRGTDCAGGTTLAGYCVALAVDPRRGRFVWWVASGPPNPGLLRRPGRAARIDAASGELRGFESLRGRH